MKRDTLYGITFQKLSGLVLLVCSLGTQAGLAADELSEQLYGRGVGPVSGEFIPIPKPLLSGAATSSEREKVLRELSKRIGWERFIKDSAVSPVVIDIEAVKNAGGKRIAHNITSGFVAYAPLATLRDQELMRGIFGESSGKNADGEADDPSKFGQEVPAEVLKEKGIVVDEQRESYALITLPLMKRVEVNGVVHIEKSEGHDWIQVVWHFDPRFSVKQDATKEDFVNTWIKFEKNSVGRNVKSLPRPYSGCGGYMTVHQLDADNNQLFVESRIIMHEPQEWFSGSQFLRSKLPLTLQENARQFRRKIKQ